MDIFRINVDIPLSKTVFISKLHDIQSNSLQEAVDIAFSREIYSGKEVLDELSLEKKEPVLKRNDIQIRPIARYDEKGIMKETLYSFTESDIYSHIGPDYTHPSRLSDVEIKQYLLRDASVNKKIDISTLEEMVFLI